MYPRYHINMLHYIFCFLTLILASPHMTHVSYSVYSLSTFYLTLSFITFHSKCSLFLAYWRIDHSMSFDSIRIFSFLSLYVISITYFLYFIVSFPNNFSIRSMSPIQAILSILLEDTILPLVSLVTLLLSMPMLLLLYFSLSILFFVIM